MATIQITPEVLKAKAAEVRNLKSQHDETMAKLQTLVHSLNDTWKGESQTAFVQKFDSMKTSFTNFSNTLESYAKMMETAAREMQNTDQSLKSAMNKFN